MMLKPGTRLKSAVCDAEVMVIKAGESDDLTCGGVALTEAFVMVRVAWVAGAATLVGAVGLDPPLLPHPRPVHTRATQAKQ